MLKDTLSLCQLPDVCGIQPYGPQLSFELHSITQGLYTAGEGLLVEAELVMANFLLHISERYVEEERQERTKQQQKSYTQQVYTYVPPCSGARHAHKPLQMIDDYVRVAPEHGSVEDVWNRVARFDCTSLSLSACVLVSQVSSQCGSREGSCSPSIPPHSKCSPVSGTTESQSKLCPPLIYTYTLLHHHHHC